MNMDRNVMTQKILNLTLEIIYLLTGEDHVVVKDHGGRTGDSSGCQVSEGPCMEPPPQSLTHDGKNAQKILNLTNQIIRLLTGEVPTRCEDVTVHLSMQEWEYVERHKDLYKDVMMEDHQPVITLDKPVSGEFHTPVSLSEFGTENATQNITDKVEKSLYKAAESAANTEQGCLTAEETHVPEKDISATSEYSQTDFKEEPASCEEGNLTDSDMYEPPEHTQTEYPSTDIKEESPTYGEGNLTDTDMYEPPEHTQMENIPGNGGEFLKVYVERHKDVMMEDHQPLITLDKPVSGEFHTPVSLPGFRTNKRAGNMTNKCRGGQKTDTAMAPAKSETHTVQESLAFEKRDVREEDTYPKSDHTLRVYPPTDIKEEPASSEIYSVVVGEASCTGDKLISTDYKRLSTHRSGHLGLQKVRAYQPFSYPEYRECFADRVALKIHQKIHMGEKPFISNCDLMSHQRNHTGEKPFKCNECGECFTWSTQLDSHKWVHSSEKPFGCSECGKRFSLKFILNQHLKIHTRDKPYKCTECGKCFTQSSNLARHKMIHTGEKPFNCTDCGKRFTQASHLMRHKLTHTGEKPHKCPDCAECFTWPTQLDSHKWIHIGRKPFSCPECGKGFSLKSQFHRHLRSHTSEKLFKFSEYTS